MPLVFVQRYTLSAVVGGTQYIDDGGVLSFSGPTEIELDPTIFNQVGVYTLFDYSAGSFPGGAAELANVTVITTGTGLTAGPLTNDTVNSRITVALS